MFVIKDKTGKIQLHIEKPKIDNDNNIDNSTFIGYIPESYFNELKCTGDCDEVIMIDVPETSSYIRITGTKPKYKVGDMIRFYDHYSEITREYGPVKSVEFDEEWGDFVYAFENDEYMTESQLDDLSY